MPKLDVVVVGLGAMGSASLYCLAKRGLNVLGIERYSPGHERSSSFGESRIIRLAYAEGGEYVPLLRSAYELWSDLEKATGEKVMIRTGMIEAGFPGSPHVKKSLLSCITQHVEREHLTATVANARYPAFDIPSGWDVIFQPDAGVLLADKAIRLFVAGAQANGANVRLNTRVLSVEPVGSQVQIVLEGGERIEAGSAVISAGPWIGDLLPELAAGLKLTRQPLMWFRPKRPALVEGMPAFMFETTRGKLFYGLPDVCGTGVKVASHRSCGALSSAEEPRASVSWSEVNRLRGMLRRYVPAAAGALTDTTRCIYTRAPRDRFIVGLHPRAPQVVIASACSGHGFKFASVMGEVLADLAIRRETDHPIGPFYPRISSMSESASRGPS